MDDFAALQTRCRELLGPTHADCYPQALERAFPHIFEKLVHLWGTPQLDTYFDELLMTTRPSREGFPEAVATDIIRLYRTYHQLGLARPDPPSSATGWHWIAGVDFPASGDKAP
jgi:hypothetical protein